MAEQRNALVLGATGGIGGVIATALLRQGWRVRGMARQMPAQAGRIDWVLGDAMRSDDVLRAADGVSTIVHAVNPPYYRDWDKLVLPMIDNTIAAARAVGGARVVLPGTIYNFDPETTPVIRSDTPQRPKSRKGAIRVALEERLRRAAPEVPALILRSGDFFGPGARSSWFSQAIITPDKPVKRIMNPARGGGHSWAYLPDLAEAFALLLDRPDRLRPFERLQFQGFFDESGTELVEAIRSVCGRNVPVRAFPWWAVRLLAPVNRFMHEAAEIAPYWRHPMRLDNTRLVELLGAEPNTLLEEAVHASLVEMGCLSSSSAIGLREASA
jgi:nucleoside-diphosphate-sugar epimerase